MAGVAAQATAPATAPLDAPFAVSGAFASYADANVPRLGGRRSGGTFASWVEGGLIRSTQHHRVLRRVIGDQGVEKTARAAVVSVGDPGGAGAGGWGGGGGGAGARGGG